MSPGRRIARGSSISRSAAKGRLDILVNNAGRGMRYVSERFLTEPTRFWEVDPAVWRMVIDTNVNGPFLMARAAAPAMRAAGWGRIVNISMNRETMRRAGFSPYGPSKAALDSETMIWAQDLAGSGVTVNALLPGGATLTGMIPATVEPGLKAKLLDPTVIVPPLLWLASEASDGVTGLRINAALWPAGVDEAGGGRCGGREALSGVPYAFPGGPERMDRSLPRHRDPSAAPPLRPPERRGRHRRIDDARGQSLDRAMADPLHNRHGGRAHR